MNALDATRAWRLGAGVLALAVLAAGLAGDAALAAGVLAGGAWHLISLWCLAQLLSAWLVRHSTRRVVGWLLLKFPLLYLAAYGLLQRWRVSAMGFGIGFTVVLVTALAWLVWQAPRLVRSPAHGR